MQDMLRDLLARLKKTVLLVTHDLDEALYLADRIVLLADGKLIADLNSQDFLRATQPEVLSYIRAFRRGEQAALHGIDTFSTGPDGQSTGRGRGR
jgi:osmoprotectant transport system ATP-binding protein